MAEYNFTRNVVSGKYDIDNPDRVDGESKQIRLADEIETALPGVDFVVRCNNSECKVITDGDLTSGQQTTLDNVVSAHQNNT